MMSRIVAIGLVLGLCGPAWAGFEEGLAAYKRYDYAAALEEWRPLAEQGDANAQYYLGELYQQGRGVRREVATAVDWYRMAAEQGQVDAQLRLAELYEAGRGVPRDIAEAVRWLLEAARRGHAEAMYRLGLKYAAGEGVTRDLVQAHKWLSLAVPRGGNVTGFLAQARLRDVVGEMTPEQIRKAEDLAGAWKPENGTRITGDPAKRPAESSVAEPAG